MHSDPIPPIEPATVRRLLRCSTDVALVLSGAGAIQEVIGPSAAASDPWKAHLGRPWVETVTRESQAKVENVVKECIAEGQSRGREINQILEHGQQSLYRFAAVRLGTETLVAVGRDLAAVSAMNQEMLSAQQAMEREYARMRQHETRYRILFQLSTEAVVILDGATLKVTEVNPAASVVLQRAAPSIAGRPFTEVIDPAAVEATRTLLLGVAETGASTTTQVLVRGGQRVSLSVAASKQGGQAALIVRIVPTTPASTEAPRRQRMIAALEALPVGFAVLDPQLNVLSANPMFCELVEIGDEKSAIGQSIDRWLGRPGIDINVIRTNLHNHGVVQNFSTVIRGNLGLTTSATVSAVSANESDMPCVGLVIHPVGARIASISPTPARSVEQLRDLVGQVPLKELVRESSELVERMCIEAALNLTSNNRASAAQLLGLSRQGLYSKLRRHGLVA